MALTEEEREELDARARRGETVVPGGKGGKSLRAQEHLAQGRMKGGKTRKEQLGIEGYKEMGRSGGQVRKQQLGTEGYRELGRRGGLSSFRKGSKSAFVPLTNESETNDPFAFVHASAFVTPTDESEINDAVKEN